LNGGWSYTWQGERTDLHTARFNTILEAVQDRFGKQNVMYSPGVSYNMKGKYWEDAVADLNEVKNMAANVDYVLLCIGENSYTETPGNLQDLTISENQLELAKTVMALGKPVIMVLNEGRPRIISKIEQGASAILQTYLPGNFGGDALADILIGKVNPSGKLPYTYPRYSNSLTNYIHKASDQVSNPQGAYDYSADFNPQFEFGHGLSYTKFEYTDLRISADKVRANDKLTVSVKVKNTGSVEGKEVVQVFVGDLLASISPDVKRLRAFEKISLKPGEEKVVSFAIPIKDLAFVNYSNKKQLEKGDFEVMVKGLKAKFELTENLSW
jgi:beta-glucosidase